MFCAMPNNLDIDKKSYPYLWTTKKLNTHEETFVQVWERPKQTSRLMLLFLFSRVCGVQSLKN